MDEDNLKKYEDEDLIIEEADETELEDDIGDISDFEDESKKDLEKGGKFKKKLPIYVAIGGFSIIVGLLAIPGVIKNSIKNCVTGEFLEGASAPSASSTREATTIKTA